MSSEKTFYDVDSNYEKYLKEAEEIMSREKTALLSTANAGNSLDTRKWAEIDSEEAIAFWEMSKCLIL